MKLEFHQANLTFVQIPMDGDDDFADLSDVSWVPEGLGDSVDAQETAKQGLQVSTRIGVRLGKKFAQGDDFPFLTLQRLNKEIKSASLTDLTYLKSMKVRVS